MMVNSKKVKGTGFERDLVDILNKYIVGGSFKRLATSGALGTVLGESELMGDVQGKVDGFPKKIKIEAKCGYGSDKQMTFRREWINKIREEAKLNNSFPVVATKFTGARRVDGTQVFVSMDIEDFIFLVNHISSLTKELDVLYNKVEESK